MHNCLRDPKETERIKTSSSSASSSSGGRFEPARADDLSGLETDVLSFRRRISGRVCVNWECVLQEY
jgi:hypothetical protein